MKHISRESSRRTTGEISKVQDTTILCCMSPGPVCWNLLCAQTIKASYSAPCPRLLRADIAMSSCFACSLTLGPHDKVRKFAGLAVVPRIRINLTWGVGVMLNRKSASTPESKSVQPVPRTCCGPPQPNMRRQGNITQIGRPGWAFDPIDIKRVPCHPRNVCRCTLNSRSCTPPAPIEPVQLNRHHDFPSGREDFPPGR